MRTVRVERTIEAPPDAVFEMLTDHAGYVRFRGVIRDMNLPFPHEGGTISVAAKDNGPHVVWESAFAAFSVRRGFERILEQVQTELA